ncbi:SDR family oxidoreductase [Pseudonocardiaceae bacterium YIM PH 21723]|nr:SDR family oxidoreductase [Pseudonocardiaceae bacterium YIM PH 21723]
MKVVIAGGHGQIALHLSRLLSERGDTVLGLIRRAEHTDDLRAVGAEPVLHDLESSSVADLAAVLTGADAVVFAAGAGPNSGAARKDTVDRAAAVLLADAAEAAGVRRYVMISAFRTDAFDPDSDDVFQVYKRAKSEADADLRARDLDWTILRPGALTNDEPTGLVEVAPEVDRASIPRADVAALVVSALDSPSSVRQQYEAVSGSTPVAKAF